MKKIGLITLIMLLLVNSAFGLTQNISITAASEIEIDYEPFIDDGSKQGHLRITIRDPNNGQEFLNYEKQEEELNESFQDTESFAVTGTAEIPITDVFVTIINSGNGSNTSPELVADIINYFNITTIINQNITPIVNINTTNNITTIVDVTCGENSVNVSIPPITVDNTNTVYINVTQNESIICPQTTINNTIIINNTVACAPPAEVHLTCPQNITIQQLEAVKKNIPPVITSITAQHEAPETGGGWKWVFVPLTMAWLGGGGYAVYYLVLRKPKQII